MTEEGDDTVYSRRKALRLVGGAATAGSLAAAGLAFVTKPAVAATTSLTANDVTLTSNAGQLQSLHVQPDIDYEWNGLENPPTRIDFYVEARLPNASGGADVWEQIGTEGTTISSSALESSTTKSYSFLNQLSILTNHSGIDDNGSDFEKTGDDWTKNTTVEIQVRTELTDDASTIYSDTPGASFTVSVTNEKGSVNSGGKANTGGSAK